MKNIKEVIAEAEMFYNKTSIDYSDNEIGVTIEVRPQAVFPRHRKNGETEWDLIDESYVTTDEPIEVSINDDGQLVVYDGHHRLNRYLKNNKKWINVVILDKITNYWF